MIKQTLQSLRVACICSLFFISQPVTAVTTFNDSVTNNAIIGGGDILSYATLSVDNNLAQKSWKAHWFMSHGGFDPALDGEYGFFLRALNGTVEIARTEKTITISDGPAIVPLPAAVWLFATALIGLFGFGKLKSRMAT